MAHTVLLKRSSTATSVPSAGQLSAGELAINTVDEKIFFKNSGGTVKSLSAMSDLTSNLVTISTTQTVTGTKNFSSITTTGLEVKTVGGDEGGQIDLGIPATNTTISTGVAIDVFQNRLRIFEKGGTSRGFYIDITAGSASAGTNLVGGGGGGTPGGSDTQVQFNDGGTTFGGDAGLTYNKTTDTLTVAGDLAVNGGDITTSSSTFNIAASATTVNFAASALAAQTLTIGNSASGSTLNLFGGAGLGATYTNTKVQNSLYFSVNTTDFGFSNSDTSGSMGFGGAGITRIGDWEGGGNSNVIEVNDTGNTITFYAAGANSYTFPTTRGSNGQVLTTNGSGTLTWNTPSGGDLSSAEILSLYSRGIV